MENKKILKLQYFQTKAFFKSLQLQLLTYFNLLKSVKSTKLKANRQKKLEKQIKIRFCTLPLTSAKSQLMLHTQKISSADLKLSQKNIKTKLDAFEGECSNIVFSIYLKQNNYNQENVKKYANNDYQIEANSPKKSHNQKSYLIQKNKQTKQNFTKVQQILIHSSQNIIKDVPLKRNLWQSRQKRNSKISLKKIKSYDFFPKENLAQSMQSGKTYKIEHKQKLIEELIRQKQKLKTQNYQLNLTVKNLFKKIQIQQKKRSKLEQKNASSDKQFKDSLKQSRQANLKVKRFEQIVEGKNKLLENLQNKLHELIKNNQKKEGAYKQQIRNQQIKLSQLGKQKQYFEFQLQRVNQKLLQKQKVFKKVFQKQQQIEQIEIINLQKRVSDKQQQKGQKNQLIKRLREEILSLQTKIQNLSKELMSKNSIQQQYKTIISQGKSQIIKMREDLKQLKKYKQITNHSQKQIFELKNEIKILSEDKNKISLNFEKVLKLKQNIQKQIKFLKQNIGENVICIDKITKENQRLQKQKLTNQKLHEQRQKSAKSQLVEAQSRIKSKQIQMNRLSKSLNEQKLQKQKIIQSHFLQRQKYQQQTKKINALKQKQIFNMKLTNLDQMKKVIQALKMQFQQRQKQNQREQFKQQDQALSKQEQIHNTKINRLTEKIKLIQTKLQFSSKQKQKQIQTLKSTLIKQKQNCTELKIQLENIASQKQIFQKQTFQLIQKIQNQKKLKETLILQNNQIKQQIQQNSLKIDSIQKEKLQINKRLNQTQKQLVQRKTQLNHKQIQLERSLKQNHNRQNSLKIQFQQSLKFQKQNTQNKNYIEITEKQKILSNRIQNLTKKLLQRDKASQQSQKQLQQCKQKYKKLIQFTKLQFALHCKDDKNKFSEILERLQKVVNEKEQSKQKNTGENQLISKIQALENQLQTHNKSIKANIAQLRSKQIEIQGYKVKYNKFKQENQTIQAQITLSTKQCKKYRIQIQNVIISLGEIKKYFSQLEQQLTLKSIGNSTLLKNTTILNQVRQSIKKLQAIAITNNNLGLSRMVSLKNDYKAQNHSPLKLKTAKSQFCDTKSMIHFNQKKDFKEVKQNLLKKPSPAVGNILLVPKESNKPSNQNTYQPNQHPNDQSMISVRSAIVSKNTKNKLNDKNFLKIQHKINNKSNLSNSMIMTYHPNNKQQMSFVDQRICNSGGSTDSNQLFFPFLNNSLFFESQSILNSSKKSRIDQIRQDNDQFMLDSNKGKSDKNVNIIDLENNKEKIMVPQINIQEAKKKQEGSQQQISFMKIPNNSKISILSKNSYQTKISEPPQLKYFAGSEASQ